MSYFYSVSEFMNVGSYHLSIYTIFNKNWKTFASYFVREVISGWGLLTATIPWANWFSDFHWQDCTLFRKYCHLHIDYFVERVALKGSASKNNVFFFNCRGASSTLETKGDESRVQKVGLIPALLATSSGECIIFLLMEMSSVGWKETGKATVTWPQNTKLSENTTILIDGTWLKGRNIHQRVNHSINQLFGRRKKLFGI